MNAPLDAHRASTRSSSATGPRSSSTRRAAPVRRPRLRRAQRAREPARQRAAGRRARGPASGSCGAGRTRSRCSPRSTRPASSTWSRCRSRTGSTPRRWHTSSTTPTRPRSSSTPSKRRWSPRCAREIPKVRNGHRVRRRRTRGLRRAGTTCCAGQPDTEPDVEPGERSRRGDDLHVGHHGQAEGRAAHPHRSPDRVRAARRAEPAARERGAPHHRPAVPLGTARVRVAVAHARRADRRAAQVRRRALDRAREGAPGHQHVLRAHPAQAHRVAARRRSWRRPTCRRWSA